MLSRSAARRTFRRRQILPQAEPPWYILVYQDTTMVTTGRRGTARKDVMTGPIDCGVRSAARDIPVWRGQSRGWLPLRPQSFEKA